MNITIVSQSSPLDWALGAISLASVGVIAWQAVMTRQSVHATQRALDLAETEQERNTALIADAQRSRIDAEMPRLTVEVVAQPGGAFDANVAHGVGYTMRYEMGHRFTMPRDRDVLIGSRAMVKIRNDGPRRVQLTAFEFKPGEVGETRSTLISLDVGEDITMAADRVESLERWIEIYDVYHRQSAMFEDAANARALSVLYDFPGSVGAVEEHLVLAGGSVVVPIADDAGAWCIPDLSKQGEYGYHSFAVQKFTRRYRLPAE